MYKLIDIPINPIITEIEIKRSYLFSFASDSIIGEPVFLFINFIEAHEIYRPPIKWRRFSHWFNRQVFPQRKFYSNKHNFTKNTYLNIYNNLYDDEIYFQDYLICIISKKEFI